MLVVSAAFDPFLGKDVGTLLGGFSARIQVKVVACNLFTPILSPNEMLILYSDRLTAVILILTKTLKLFPDYLSCPQ